ncbi:hypothetical protein Tco_0324633 [Tanacetum coccineum]
MNPLVPQDRWFREKHIDLVNIIGEPLAGVTTKSKIRDSEVASAHECLYVKFLSEIEPKKLIEAPEEEGWIIAMQEELNRFERNKVWTLVPVPYGKTIIGTKWIFRNKKDENGVVIRNKARLQSFIAMSTAKAESVAAARYCAQVLWIKSWLADYDVLYDKGDIELYFVPTNMQLADIFTKPLAEPSFTRLVAELGMLNIEKEVPDKIKALSDMDGGLANMGLVDKKNPTLSITSMVVLLPMLKEILFTNMEGSYAICCQMSRRYCEDYKNDELTSFKSHTISTASVKKPLASKVTLTSHMLKVANLLPVPEESLIISFGERMRMTTLIINIDHTVKVSEKTRILEHNRRFQESLLILTTYTYHSRDASIRGGVQNQTDEEVEEDTGIKSLRNVSFDELYGMTLNKSGVWIGWKALLTLSQRSSLLGRRRMISDLESMLDDAIELISRFETNTEDDEDTDSETKGELSKID